MAPLNVQLFIDGQKQNSSSGETFKTYHPGTQILVGVVQSASSEDIQRAVNAANTAFPAWEATMAHEKQKILNRAADLLESEEYLRKLSESIPKEIGALSIMAKTEPHGAATQLREAAAKSIQIVGETFPSGRVPGATVIVQRRAYGVVLGIAPWNSPLNLAARAVAVPLICGNAVILKSSDVCPRTHEILVEALHEAGLPRGVLNLIHISPELAPKLVPEIIANPLIRHVNFTGGDRVGRLIATEAGKNLKPCIMELGGKAAAIVLEDANVKLAARAIISGAMLNSGQICMSTERIIVQRSVAEQLIQEVTTLAKKIKAGPDGTGSHICGVFNTSSAKRIVDLLKDAKNAGAEILVGDLKHDGPYVQPHVVLGYKPEMNAWKEETFGPVFGITICETIDEAVELANKTDFSLTSSLWSNSLKALAIASRIRAGEVMINGSTFHPEPSIEVHGVGGSSGWGRFDVENFTQRRVLIVHPEEVKFPLVDDLGL